MKNVLLFIFLMSAAVKIGAQALTIEYDAAGLRKARYLKPMLVPDPVNALKTKSVPNNPKTVTVGDKEIAVAVSPNPSTGIFQIYESEPVPDAQFNLYDVTGRLLWSQSAENTESNIDITQKPPGNYVLILTQAKETIATWKLIKD